MKAYADSIREFGSLLLIPVAVFSSFLLKRKDLLTTADKVVYIVCSFSVAYTAPDFIMALFPTLDKNAESFLCFLSAIFGGIIVLNVWRVLSTKDFWRQLVDSLLKRRE